ncbi:MAG: NTP transferase domain-containing protein [Syntrophobacteria bacterium]
MNDAVGLVLAAGKGTRMHSDLAKVLHPICGQPMLFYPLAVLKELGLARVLVVVGYQAERIQELFATAGVEWVVQVEQQGTAHAVNCALPHLAGSDRPVLICCGDTPLVTAKTLGAFLGSHLSAAVDLSILSAVLEQPAQYGRILRDCRQQVVAIVEAVDAREEELDIREVNTGIYCASVEMLRAVVPLIDNGNVQGEYYLTDMVQRAVEQGWRVQAVVASNFQEFLGVNTREELAAATEVISKRSRSASR